MSTYDEHQAALSDAIRAVAGGSIVTHYVVVAAVIDEDGDGPTHTITSPGLPLWMTHGLLSYEAAATTPQPPWAYQEDE